MNLRHYIVGRIRDGLGWRIQNYRWKVFLGRLEKQDVINRAFDARFGTETATEHRLNETGVPEADIKRGNTFYRPFWESDFRAVLSKFALDFSQFAFIDIGSGKGKLLMLAAEHPFRKIVGVEYSPGLHDVAVSNIDIYRRATHTKADFELVQGDALDYRLPPGAIFCLIFNSMDPATTRKVLLNFDRDIAGRSEPVFVVYANLRTVSEIGNALSDTPNLHNLYHSRRITILGNAAAQQERINRRVAL